MEARRSFILRIWRNGDGTLYGQISDPFDGWRTPFQDAAELWRVLLARIAQPPPPTSHPTEQRPEDEA